MTRRLLFVAVAAVVLLAVTVDVRVPPAASNDVPFAADVDVADPAVVVASVLKIEEEDEEEGEDVDDTINNVRRR